jgi:membrane protease subunit (stomatin/prohibitin family)
MSEKIEFVRNYNDLSTDRGFQYEFMCDRCGSGFRTGFKASATGMVNEALDAASGLLGGIFGRAAQLGDRVHNVAWERAHDAAFREAVEEIKPDFVQCPRCSKWVCRNSCWNEKKGLCKECAPDVGVEMAAAQASRTVEEVWAHAQVAEEDLPSKVDWREGVRATCPKCEEPLEGDVKFCPKCGAEIKAKKHCTQCGAKLAAAAKFCGECGTKAEG